MSKKAKQHISARVPTERVEVLKASGISVNAFINQVFNELLANPIFPEDSDKERESKIKFITKLAILKAERKKLEKLQKIIEESRNEDWGEQEYTTHWTTLGSIRNAISDIDKKLKELQKRWLQLVTVS